MSFNAFYVYLIMPSYKVVHRIENLGVQIMLISNILSIKYSWNRNWSSINVFGRLMVQFCTISNYLGSPKLRKLAPVAKVN